MIKNQLSTIMGNRKMKQSELVRITGLSPNTVKHMYHETNSSIDYKVLEKVCKALEIQPGELLIMEVENEEPKKES